MAGKPTKTAKDLSKIPPSRGGTKIAPGLRNLSIDALNTNGRPAKPVDRTMVESMARRGAPKLTIAAILGMDVETLYRKQWQTDNGLESFMEVYSRAFQAGNLELFEALHTKARHGNIQALKFSLQNRTEWRDRVEASVNVAGTLDLSLIDRIMESGPVIDVDPADQGPGEPLLQIAPGEPGATKPEPDK